jgi:transcriptional regulator CtsR
MRGAINDKTIQLPQVIRDQVRSQILKTMLITVIE